MNNFQFGAASWDCLEVFTLEKKSESDTHVSSLSGLKCFGEEDPGLRRVHAGESKQI